LSALSDEEVKHRFRKGLFEDLDTYTKEYAESAPYKHAVIHGLIDDDLLRHVREEVKDNVSFTPKETDIYKIHQSGDLANLDGLEDEALSKLPSLLALRDAMYSEQFRNYVSHITGCGPLSGRKTDLAINIYTPGCFLLCHDDVIGSRKVSFILYLTDPEIPWEPEWGGALRLFPVEEKEGEGGVVAKTPLADPTKVIPPAWNQLSFFAVQPGESFHDVEEVYHAQTKEQLELEGGRVRMAISGWFHIPQVGEVGYAKGAEERWGENSSLMQLQGDPDQYDMPQPQRVPVKHSKTTKEEFSEEDLEFLLKYMAPSYLTPDALEQIQQQFDEDSFITLPALLNKNFSEKLRKSISDADTTPLPGASTEIEKGIWKVARPPHKHRYLYIQAKTELTAEMRPLEELLNVFLASPEFRLWLQMATSSVVESHDLIARRFRRGEDYTLATGYNGKPILELALGLTPTTGWGDDDDDDEDSDAHEAAGKGKAKAAAQVENEEPADSEVGGHEVYMADDDGAGEDAAVYKSSGDEENILFFQAPAWNKLSIVLRDSGSLKFVKHISQRAPGARWDVCGTFEIEDQDADDTEEEEWNGFSSSSSEEESD
jgi:prolyl 3-hydroxylase /prolyl 3,4-dihydroxylase